MNKHAVWLLVLFMILYVPLPSAGATVNQIIEFSINKSTYHAGESINFYAYYYVSYDDPEIDVIISESVRILNSSGYSLQYYGKRLYHTGFIEWNDSIELNDDLWSFKNNIENASIQLEVRIITKDEIISSTKYINFTISRVSPEIYVISPSNFNIQRESYGNITIRSCNPYNNKSLNDFNVTYNIIYPDNNNVTKVTKTDEKGLVHTYYNVTNFIKGHINLSITFYGHNSYLTRKINFTFDIINYSIFVNLFHNNSIYKVKYDHSNISVLISITLYGINDSLITNANTTFKLNETFVQLDNCYNGTYSKRIFVLSVPNNYSITINGSAPDYHAFNITFSFKVTKLKYLVNFLNQSIWMDNLKISGYIYDENSRSVSTPFIINIQNKSIIGYSDNGFFSIGLSNVIYHHGLYNFTIQINETEVYTYFYEVFNLTVYAVGNINTSSYILFNNRNNIVFVSLKYSSNKSPIIGLNCSLYDLNTSRYYYSITNNSGIATFTINNLEKTGPHVFIIKTNDLLLTFSNNTLVYKVYSVVNLSIIYPNNVSIEHVFQLNISLNSSVSFSIYDINESSILWQGYINQTITITLKYSKISQIGSHILTFHSNYSHFNIKNITIKLLDILNPQINISTLIHNKNCSLYILPYDLCGNLISDIYIRNFTISNIFVNYTLIYSNGIYMLFFYLPKTIPYGNQTLSFIISGTFVTQFIFMKKIIVYRFVSMKFTATPFNDEKYKNENLLSQDNIFNAFEMISSGVINSPPPILLIGIIFACFGASLSISYFNCPKFNSGTKIYSKFINILRIVFSSIGHTVFKRKWSILKPFSRRLFTDS